MTENEISGLIVDAAIKVHKKLGPGLLESVYRIVLAYELRKLGLQVQREEPIPIRYESIVFEEAFRADLIVDGKVIIELKSIDKLGDVHKKQLLSYLRMTDNKLGLLLNFGQCYLKDGIVRVVNGLEDTKNES